MRFKPVPEPPADLNPNAIGAIREAVPVVPKPETDCCARIVERSAIDDRDLAADWLPFLRALGLVEEHERGYARTSDEPDPDALAERFLERVLLADAVHDALGEEPLAVDAVFDRVREGVPRWERERTTDWADRHRERVGRLLEWLVLWGLAERVDGGYVRIGSP